MAYFKGDGVGGGKAQDFSDILAVKQDMTKSIAPGRVRFQQHSVMSSRDVLLLFWFCSKIKTLEGVNDYIPRDKKDCTVRFGQPFTESFHSMPWQQGWYISGTLRKQF